VKWENVSVTTVPIACTLTAEAVVDRRAEWERFLSTMVQSVDHEGGHAILTLLGGSEPLLTGADLAEREKACCAFFDFSIELDGSGARLHVGVPLQAEPVLAGLLALLPDQLRARRAGDTSDSSSPSNSVTFTH
jgi:hypothetical protein